MRGNLTHNPHDRHLLALGVGVVDRECGGGEVDFRVRQPHRGACGNDTDLNVRTAGSGTQDHGPDVDGQVQDHPRFGFAFRLRLHGGLVRGALKHFDDRDRLGGRRRIRGKARYRALCDSLCGTPLGT